MNNLDKLEIVKSKSVNNNVLNYLTDKLSNLSIEVYNRRKYSEFYTGNVFELANMNILEGWCWQTTESVILFLNDDDYIERGYIDVGDDPEYYHSWICFRYDNNEYIFDPCLNFLCQKKHFIKILNSRVLGKVSAKDVRSEFIRQFNIPKEEKKDNYISRFFRETLGDKYNEYEERTKNEIIMYGNENINTPFYRNGAGYKADIKDDKIKKLTVHYYDNCC